MDRRADFDAFAPAQIAERVQNVGVVKARAPFFQLAMLGMLAGAFIGLGSLFYVIVVSDGTLGFAAARVLGGFVFSLGLVLVVVAGAELFTGNNLLAMAWADGSITTAEVMRNWAIVCVANFVGALGLAFLVFMSGHTEMNSGAIGKTYLQIAAMKSSLGPVSAFFRAVLCNILVCMAVWMTLGGRSVTDKIVAILFPITAFVAAGFEHSIANMYFIPMGMLLKAAADVVPPGTDAIGFAGLFGNLVPVILGNIVGGSVLVALVYHVIYRRGAAAAAAAAAKPASPPAGSEPAHHA
jgi:formate transporter